MQDVTASEISLTDKDSGLGNKPGVKVGLLASILFDLEDLAAAFGTVYSYESNFEGYYIIASWQDFCKDFVVVFIILVTLVLASEINVDSPLKLCTAFIAIVSQRWQNQCSSVNSHNISCNLSGIVAQAQKYHIKHLSHCTSHSTGFMHASRNISSPCSFTALSATSLSL